MIILLRLGRKASGSTDFGTQTFCWAAAFVYLSPYDSGAACAEPFPLHVLPFPAMTLRHRGQGVLEESEVYLLQRGHFALAIGRAITL